MAIHGGEYGYCIHGGELWWVIMANNSQLLYNGGYWLS